MKKVMVKGPSEMKGQGGKTHKGIKGPSEMYAAGAKGPKHKGVKGADEIHESSLGTKKVSHGVPKEHLMQGHKKLGKVSPDKLGMIQPKDNEGEDTDDGAEY